MCKEVHSLLKVLMLNNSYFKCCILHSVSLINVLNICYCISLISKDNIHQISNENVLHKTENLQKSGRGHLLVTHRQNVKYNSVMN